MSDTQPGRRRRNAAARAELAAARTAAMPARHRQKLAHLAASPASQPLIEHLDRLRATAKAMTAATTDHTEESTVSVDTEWTTATAWTEMLLPAWAVIADPAPVPGEPAHLVAPIEHTDADESRVAVNLGWNGDRDGGGYVPHVVPWDEVLGVFPSRNAAEVYRDQFARAVDAS